MDETMKKWVITGVLIICAFISAFALKKPLSSPETHKKSIATLTGKEENVLKLTGAAATASFMVSMLPDDTGSSVADQLAQLTDLFGIALIAVVLEKYLLTISGYAAFGFIIPIGLLLLALYVHKRQEQILSTAVKLIAFGFLIFAVVPVSVKISDIIEKNYAVSMEAAIAQAKDTAAEIAETTELATTEAATETETEKKGVLAGIADAVGGAAGSVADGVSDTISDLAGNATELLNKATVSLQNLMEAAAVMIVTSCVIPLLVLVFLVWSIKMMMGTNVRISSPVRLNRGERPKQIEKKEERL